MELNENYSRFITLYTSSVPILRSYLRKLLPTWEDVDEVLQNTSLVLWEKFETYEDGTEFCKWACVIARFECLNYKRTKARDKHQFGDELFNLLADESLDHYDKYESERKALNSCLSKLDTKQQEITLKAYSAKSIKEVAQEYSRSATALYKALKRIRTNLLKCIKKETVDQ
ncbi:MAG: sigma-70 family RNA polymerase sigma factor [Lentisphaeraceae bacterium]|nr:sigma-70 family RNA polymerase sigma factor [Lentisphaeraceae bacterium]